MGTGPPDRLAEEVAATAVEVVRPLLRTLACPQEPVVPLGVAVGDAIHHVFVEGSSIRRYEPHRDHGVPIPSVVHDLPTRRAGRPSAAPPGEGRQQEVAADGDDQRDADGEQQGEDPHGDLRLT